MFEKISQFPSLIRIEKENGRGVAKAIIATGIAEMIEGLPHELTGTAINRLAEFILANHKHLTPPEFRLIGDRLLRRKIYGKLNINIIAHEIDLYWQERNDYAEDEAIKKAGKISGQIASDDVLRSYERMKREAEAKKAKNTSAETRRLNDEKIERLKKEYGKDFKPDKRN